MSSPQSWSEREEAELHYLILSFLEASPCENTFQVYRDEATNLGLLPNGLSYDDVKGETHLNTVPPKFLLEILKAAGTLLRRQELGKEYESVTERLLNSAYDNGGGISRLLSFLCPEVVGAVTRINCNPMNSLAHHTTNKITPMRTQKKRHILLLFFTSFHFHIFFSTAFIETRM